MNAERFNEILERRIAQTREVLGAKAEEYATDADRLHNFKAAGELSNTTPEQALWGMWVKHLISVRDMCNSSIPPTRAKLDEKIGDAVNYAILLESLFIERIEDGE